MIFHDLSKRAIYTIISLLIIATLLIFAYVPLVSWIITLLTATLGGIAMWEFVKLTNLSHKKRYRKLLIASTVIVILGFYCSTLKSTFSLLPLGLLFLGIIAVFIYHFNKIQGCTQSIAQGFFGLFYVAVPLGLILKILYLYSACKIGHEGRMWLIYLLVVTKITDVGAYFGGRLFGNKKLAASISPGKTIAGALSGFVVAIIFSFIFYALAHLLPNFFLTFYESLWLGALIGIFGQVGDLAESLLKRDADVKDSNCLPGLGGILDMVDSLLFTAPLIYFFLYFC
ncbi:MAG: phosphatidate cytidylyltransferase [Simkania sp.]|nr:phosphatidate cytidylyltransferase [Simkania sp.]MCB1074947.1 phosphatidate cytidylyltransferase [Simkania sp.]MCB1082943.1 phosphatidate cytidylyltransferase [Simkania sp.]MCP5489762.1 phosphatidate cytidylyltransferase [Chlamydiales bacterium]